MKTYIIALDDLYYALGMDSNSEYVFSLEAPSRVAKMYKERGVTGRNEAIRSICYGYRYWKDAYHQAKRSGDYMGILFKFG